MHLQEKRAWYALGIALAALAIYFALLTAGVGRGASSAALSLAALLGFLPLLGWRARRSGDVLLDERDATIARSAALIALSVVWVAFVAVAVVTALVLGSRRSITVTADGPYAAVMVAFCALYLARAVVILLLYRGGGGGSEG
jgi:hypothetical protein